jgi:uncharacterized membrane protein YphA (DoxX/SURF4 family)
MFNRLTAPGPASGLLRLGLAIIFLSHGGLKIAFGATTWSNTPVPGSNAPLPPALQAAVAWGELVIGCACLLGLLTRLACLGIIVIMIGAFWMETRQRDFIEVNTDLPSLRVSNQVVGFNRISPGYEYNFAISIMAGALILLGSGPLSVDQALARRRRAAGDEAQVSAVAPASPKSPSRV